MRAQTVNFERGLNPKDALEIGRKNARDFRKALQEKDYRGEGHLQNMINGLTEGSIPEDEAIKFIENGIIHFNTKRSLHWYEWFSKDGYCFWGSDVDKFIITFDMPDFDYFGQSLWRKIRCEIFEVESLQDWRYEIDTKLQVEGENNSMREIFPQNNVFPANDPVFKLGTVVHSISRVVENAIRNLG